ncbi:MAG: DUF4112 domain-containing protein [Proteobacteria bacterium]|nr:DUF4112 domain-containing protein [Pseudomonadota bacterium]
MNPPRGHHSLSRMRAVAWWLDNRFRIPGTNIRFGLDVLLGLLPGIGDSVSALSGVYFISQAHALGVPLPVKLRMAGNVLGDMIVGAVPLLGDIFDIGFKANMRNLALIEDHLARTGNPAGGMRTVNPVSASGRACASRAAG